jgi:hypothetical protein
VWGGCLWCIRLRPALRNRDMSALSSRGSVFVGPSRMPALRNRDMSALSSCGLSTRREAGSGARLARSTPLPRPRYEIAICPRFRRVGRWSSRPHSCPRYEIAICPRFRRVGSVVVASSLMPALRNGDMSALSSCAVGVRRAHGRWAAATAARRGASAPSGSAANAAQWIRNTCQPSARRAASRSRS